MELTNPSVSLLRFESKLPNPKESSALCFGVLCRGGVFPLTARTTNRRRNDGDHIKQGSWSVTKGVDLRDQDISFSYSDLNSVEAVMRCVQIDLLCVHHQAMDISNIKRGVSI
ncbi:hypothetical protein AALP_AA3G277500 [Arabis alpina]|uniref:Uncharacterized protein n=1 Tax=Arabis alpina TaxID=50452 RepID=A0A087HC48_ARAAL|nr:hypothetical protein AALP_AA3G277500 [Arabis alpina]